MTAFFAIALLLFSILFIISRLPPSNNNLQQKKNMYTTSASCAASLLLRRASRRGPPSAAFFRSLTSRSAAAAGGARFHPSSTCTLLTTNTTGSNEPVLLSRRSYSATSHPLASDSDSHSHSDFAPQKKSIDEDDDAAQAMIRDHVTSNRIMLYMKGTPSMPMCGFSARVVGALQNEDVNFSSVNVLDYPSIREGVKKYAEWPTIPQLYVDGEFVGGCDIVMSMAESGELSDLLKEGEENKE